MQIARWLPLGHFRSGAQLGHSRRLRGNTDSPSTQALPSYPEDRLSFTGRAGNPGGDRAAAHRTALKQAIMQSGDYKYSVKQCDVPQERHPALEAFRAKRRQWVAWLDTDEHHAIWTTISSMVWNDVSFRTLAQMARDTPDTCLGNSLVAEHIIHGHIARQVLAIRRLADTGIRKPENTQT
jgi:hypothetical protein